MTTTLQQRVQPDPDGLIRRTVTFDTRAVTNPDAREFVGIGVPWDVVIEHWFGAECFDRGSVEDDGAKLLYGHRDPVGPMLSATDVDEGRQIKARISDTTLGRDVWTLVRDGVINQLSIGFEPIEYRVDEDEVLHWTCVRAREYSLVAFPAYETALLDPSSLREAISTTERTTMPATVTTEALTRADLDPINAALDDLERATKRIEANQASTISTGLAWRSMGDFLKALAAGDQDAAEFHRAYTGATTDDTVMQDTFVGEYIKLVNEHRRLVDDFTHGTLPDKGMSIDYVKLGADTTRVEEQVNQGDDLPYGKVTLVDANAKIKTAGGWTELSRQAIERATVPTLNITLRALGLKYARYTNALVGAALRAQIAANIAADADDDTAALDLPANATVDQWLDMVVDAAIAMEERGFNLAQMHVSGDVFKRMIRLKDGDNRLMKVWGQGVNQVGELDLTSVKGNLAGVTVKLLTGATTNQAAFSDPVAIELLESPGAPAQLQDENIINLTKQFSIYGYVSTLVPFPTAILPVEFGA